MSAASPSGADSKQPLIQPAQSQHPQYSHSHALTAPAALSYQDTIEFPKKDESILTICYQALLAHIPSCVFDCLHLIEGWITYAWKKLFGDDEMPDYHKYYSPFNPSNGPLPPRKESSESYIASVLHPFQVIPYIPDSSPPASANGSLPRVYKQRTFITTCKLAHDPGEDEEGWIMRSEYAGGKGINFPMHDQLVQEIVAIVDQTIKDLCPTSRCWPFSSTPRLAERYNLFSPGRMVVKLELVVLDLDRQAKGVLSFTHANSYQKETASVKIMNDLESLKRELTSFESVYSMLESRAIKIRFFTLKFFFLQKVEGLNPTFLFEHAIWGTTIHPKDAKNPSFILVPALRKECSLPELVELFPKDAEHLVTAEGDLETSEIFEWESR